MRIRIRGPAGQTVATFPDTATIGDLQTKITESTSLTLFDVKYGYPPKNLLLDAHSPATKLSDTNIDFNGEQLIVSKQVIPITTSQNAEPPHRVIRADASKLPEPGSSSAQSHSAILPPRPIRPRSAGSAPRKATRNSALKDEEAPPTDAPELALASHGSTLILRIMPDDNSCLFRAFNSAFFGAMDNMTELRSIIAQHIQMNPATYSAVVLDKKPDDYCRWIQTENAWGGAIELDILSKHFELEISSIDVQTLRVDKYNEGRPSRCILVYSGIHYDVIALSPSDPPYDRAYAPPEFDVKIFEQDDEEVLEKAVELCRVLQKRHYYTDTAAFTIRCNDCGGMFRGERGATEHASATGHYNFGEAA